MQTSARRSELFDTAMAMTDSRDEPFNLAASAVRHNPQQAYQQPMSPDVVQRRPMVGAIAADPPQDQASDPIWVRLTIDESAYPPIAVNKAALSLFADRVQIRVPETKFTITVYFRDVFKLEPFVERQELVLHTGSFSHRRYTLGAFLPSTVPMMFEILASRIVERDVKFSGAGSSLARGASPSAQTMDWIALSPDGRRSLLGAEGSGFSALRSTGQQQQQGPDEFYALVHTPPAGKDMGRGRTEASHLPQQQAGSSLGQQLPLHLRLSRAGNAAAPLAGGSSSPNHRDAFWSASNGNSSRHATDLSTLLALTRDSRKPPVVRPLSPSIPEPEQRWHTSDGLGTSNTHPPAASSTSSRTHSHGVMLMMPTDDTEAEEQQMFQHALTQAASGAGAGRRHAVQQDVSAPAPPLWLIQRNLAEMEQRERALHLRAPSNISSSGRKFADPSIEQWNGYHVEPAHGEFVFDQPPPAQALYPPQRSKQRALIAPRVSPPRSATAAASRQPSRVDWAAAVSDITVESSKPFDRNSRAQQQQQHQPPSAAASEPSYRFASASAAQSSLSVPPEVAAAQARDRLFAAMVVDSDATGGMASLAAAGWSGDSAAAHTTGRGSGGPPPPPAARSASSMSSSMLPPSRRPGSGGGGGGGASASTSPSASSSVTASKTGPVTISIVPPKTKPQLLPATTDPVVSPPPTPRSTVTTTAAAAPAAAAAGEAAPARQQAAPIEPLVGRPAATASPSVIVVVDDDDEGALGAGAPSSPSAQKREPSVSEVAQQQHTLVMQELTRRNSLSQSRPAAVTGDVRAVPTPPPSSSSNSSGAAAAANPQLRPSPSSRVLDPIPASAQRPPISPAPQQQQQQQHQLASASQRPPPAPLTSWVGPGSSTAPTASAPPSAQQPQPSSRTASPAPLSASPAPLSAAATADARQVASPSNAAAASASSSPSSKRPPARRPCDTPATAMMQGADSSSGGLLTRRSTLPTGSFGNNSSMASSSSRSGTPHEVGEGLARASSSVSSRSGAPMARPKPRP